MSEKSALELWKKKLKFFQAEQTTAVESGQKFKLQQDIAEAKAKIAELAGVVAPAFTQPTAPAPLPRGADKLFGREKELADLEEAWKNPAVHVVTLVAWGGVGKSALVADWRAKLAARDFDGADSFEVSFYSQGTKEQGAASGNIFLAAALKQFGDPAMAGSPASPSEKGARLAQLLGEQRALLILDGLEPLQHPPKPLEGDLKDPGIAALLRGLAKKNAGLCVVTTRVSVNPPH